MCIIPKFIHIHHIKSKIKTNGLLSDPLTFMRFARSVYFPWLASFISADKRIKGIQIGDHKIKIVTFVDNTTIFMGDITCLNTMS